MCIRISGGKWHMQQELQSLSAWVWIQRFLTADLLQKSQFENRMLFPMLFKAISWKQVFQVDYKRDMPLHFCSWTWVIGYAYFISKNLSQVWELTQNLMQSLPDNAAAVTVHDLGESCNQLWPVTGKACLQSNLCCHSFSSALTWE